MNALDRWLFAPAPAARLAAVRVLVGAFCAVYLTARIPYLTDVARLPESRFDPVGPLGFLDAPVRPSVVTGLLVVTLGALVAFTVGWRYRITGPLAAASALVLTTYGQSWGQVFHTENLAVLHLGVLAVAPAADAWSLDERRRSARPPTTGYGWPLQLATAVTVATYVLAGIAKLRNGGLDWVGGDVLRTLVAHDNLRKILLDDPHSPIGGWLVQFAWVFPVFAAVSVAVELGAPAALRPGRLRLVWIGAAWTFHLGVLALMAVFFPYPLTGVAFASMLPAERVVDPIRALGRRLGPAGTLPADA